MFVGSFALSCVVYCMMTYEFAMWVATVVSVCSLWFFFFKQKTAYEMRISDWSSDVCSSDLIGAQGVHGGLATAHRLQLRARRRGALCPVRRLRPFVRPQPVRLPATGNQRRFLYYPHVQLHYRRSREQIGRASCRERVCQYV